MGTIAYIKLGRSTVRGILPRAVKMNELHAVGHFFSCNCAVYYAELDSRRHKISDAQCHADTRATIDLLWKVSLLLRSPCHSWSNKMQVVHNGPHAGQCVVYFRHWPLRNVVHCVTIDLSGTLKRYSTMSIFIFLSTFMAMPTIKYKNSQTWMALC